MVLSQCLLPSCQIQSPKIPAAPPASALGLLSYGAGGLEIWEEAQPAFPGLAHCVVANLWNY